MAKQTICQGLSNFLFGLSLLIDKQFVWNYTEFSNATYTERFTYLKGDTYGNHKIFGL